MAWAHASGGVDVVVLEHDRVREAVAVEVPAAQAHRLALEEAHAGRGLAGADQARPGALQHAGDPRRVGGDAAHALQVVEGHALCLKQGAHVGKDRGQVLAARHRGAVLHQALNAGCGVYELECALKDGKPRHHAVLLADELHAAGTGLRHDRHGADVAKGHVLLERRADGDVHLCQDHGVDGHGESSKVGDGAIGARRAGGARVR